MLDVAARAAANPEKVKPKLRGWSHLFAFFLALGAGGVLVSEAPTSRALWAVVVYSLSLATMFGVSAAYHRPMWSLARRRLMRRLDHAGIFLLIAGTYTPVCVLGGHGLLLTVVWTGAILGVLHSAFLAHRFRAFNAVLYVTLGCAAVPVVPSLLVTLGVARTVLILLGGAIYIGGAVVYARRWPNPVPAVFGYHEVFHLMVILASGAHFAAVLDLVRDAH